MSIERTAHGHRTTRDRPERHGRPRQPPDLRLVRRAPRSVRLRRHLRARSPDGGRRRLPRRRRGARQGTRHEHHPLPGRQLRLRLPLGGRRRPTGGPARAARPRLALARDQPGGRRRVRELVQAHRQRDDDGRQPRYPRRARSTRPPRVHEPPERHGPVGPAHRQRCAGAVRHPHVVPRQRDGRPVRCRPTTTASSPPAPRRR
jgi:hypothetical protein